VRELDECVLDDAVARTGRHQGDVAAAIELAADLGPRVPQPGSGATARRWELLARVAEIDLTTARVLEAHLDALAILAEAPSGDRSAVESMPARRGSGARTWGVFAAEASDARLVAACGTDGGASSWTLSGRKPWCSLADRLTHALVTAEVPGGRRLFAIALDEPGVHVVPGTWHARGLNEVRSGPVDLDGVPAVPVGDTGWYLARPGFAHGGIGVAACWWGGSLGVARALLRAAARREPDQIGYWHVGQAGLDLFSARACLDAAAHAIDAGEADGEAGAALALRVRSVVAQTAEAILDRVGHALGPAPLTFDEGHARRVADLTVYVRQHHAERDVARLGEQLLSGGAPW
jgi:alkylation response protein AidB-like acyl-CoA dehydrogenase